ncbi:sigma-70 family RNA polymerase sigma factor [Verrucomicrobiota bacterium]
MEDTDYKLLARYKAGQTEALESLVEKYRRQLFGYIINMRGYGADADEIFQEVWFRVIKKIHTYKHKNFLGWLMRIAHNIVIDKARHKKHDVSLDQERENQKSLADVMPGGEQDPAELLQADTLGQKISEAVAELPAEQKEVFLMRVKSDLSFKEIAGIQKVSINTALARMQYALAKLREDLKEDYKELNR